jgi:hypothetical protein
MSSRSVQRQLAAENPTIPANSPTLQQTPANIRLRRAGNMQELFTRMNNALTCTNAAPTNPGGGRTIWESRGLFGVEGPRYFHKRVFNVPQQTMR